MSIVGRKAELTFRIANPNRCPEKDVEYFVQRRIIGEITDICGVNESQESSGGVMAVLKCHDKLYSDFVSNLKLSNLPESESITAKIIKTGEVFTCGYCGTRIYDPRVNICHECRSELREME